MHACVYMNIRHKWPEWIHSLVRYPKLLIPWLLSISWRETAPVEWESVESERLYAIFLRNKLKNFLYKVFIDRCWWAELVSIWNQFYTTNGRIYKEWRIKREYFWIKLWGFWWQKLLLLIELYIYVSMFILFKCIHFTKIYMCVYSFVAYTHIYTLRTKILLNWQFASFSSRLPGHICKMLHCSAVFMSLLLLQSQGLHYIIFHPKLYCCTMLHGCSLWVRLLVN